MAHTDPRVAPDWAADLVIYELNPRAFTSPEGVGDGSGSGTFASTREKLPYLADLGINAVWMAGHHLATKHFYGMWSVYAALDHAQIDPVLGTPDELKALVADAHSNGIRVFLDVISHGVLHEAALVDEHPDWFKSSSWGMSDFDYANAEFREWWIALWVGYALDYGIDGFRVDVTLGDAEIWDEVVTRVRAAGSDVVVFGELERYHFAQKDSRGTVHNPIIEFGFQYFQNKRFGLSTHELSCHDYGWTGLPGNHFYLKGSRARAAHGALLGPVIPLFLAGEEFDADPVPLPDVTQGLYGTGGPGGWMYGNRLDWDQLADPAKAAMLADVKTMLGMRRRFPHILNASGRNLKIAMVPSDGTTGFVPYALASGSEGLVVLASEADHEVTARIRVPRDDLGFPGDAKLIVTDAVTGVALESDHDGTFAVPIGADRTPGGGYRLLHVAAQ